MMKGRICTATYRFLLVCTVALIMVATPTRGDDFGMDFSVEANKKLIDNRLTLGLGLDARTQDNTSQMERYGIEVGGNYKLIDTKQHTLKAGVTFEQMWMKNLSETKDTYKTKYYSDKFNYLGNGEFGPIEKGYNVGHNYDASFWRGRSRLNMSVAYSVKLFKRLSVTLKETVQYNHFYQATTERTKFRTKYRYNAAPTDTVYTVDEIKYCKNRWMLRSKLTLQYSRKRCPWEPYVAVDYGCGLGNDAWKWKFIGGTEYKITKQHTLNVFYRYQKENDDDEPDGHIIGLGYSFKF